MGLEESKYYEDTRIDLEKGKKKIASIKREILKLKNDLDRFNHSWEKKEIRKLTRDKMDELKVKQKKFDSIRAQCVRHFKRNAKNILSAKEKQEKISEEESEILLNKKIDIDSHKFDYVLSIQLNREVYGFDDVIKVDLTWTKKSSDSIDFFKDNCDVEVYIKTFKEKNEVYFAKKVISGLKKFFTIKIDLKPLKKKLSEGDYFICVSPVEIKKKLFGKSKKFFKESEEKFLLSQNEVKSDLFNNISHNIILTATVDELKFWKTSTLKEIKKFDIPNWIKGIEIFRNEFLVIGTKNTSVHTKVTVYEMGELKEIKKLFDFTEYTKLFVCANMNDEFLAISSKETIKLWKFPHQHAFSYLNIKDVVDIKYVHPRKIIALRNGCLNLFLDNGILIGKWKIESIFVNKFCYVSGSKIIVTKNPKHSVHLYSYSKSASSMILDVYTGKTTSIIDSGDYKCFTAIFNGQYIIAGGLNGELYVLDNDGNQLSITQTILENGVHKIKEIIVGNAVKLLVIGTTAECIIYSAVKLPKIVELKKEAIIESDFHCFKFINACRSLKEMENERLNSIMDPEKYDFTLKLGNVDIELYKSFVSSSSQVLEGKSIQFSDVKISIDPKIVITLLIGGVVPEGLKPQDYIDLFMIFHSLRMGTFVLVLLRHIARKLDVEILLELFELSFETFEKVEEEKGEEEKEESKNEEVEEVIKEEEEEEEFEMLTPMTPIVSDDIEAKFEYNKKRNMFKSVFTLNIFNSLKISHYTEIVDAESYMDDEGGTEYSIILENLGLWEEYKNHVYDPVENYMTENYFFEGESFEKSFKDAFQSSCASIHANRKCVNFKIATKNGKVIDTNKEILVASSNFFFNLLKFPWFESMGSGKSWGQDSDSDDSDNDTDDEEEEEEGEKKEKKKKEIIPVKVDVIDHETLEGLIRFFFTRRIDGCNFGVLLKMLEHSEMYFQADLRRIIMEDIERTVNSELEELEVEKLRNLFLENERIFHSLPFSSQSQILRFICDYKKGYY